MHKPKLSEDKGHNHKAQKVKAELKHTKGQKQGRQITQTAHKCRGVTQMNKGTTKEHSVIQYPN